MPELKPITRDGVAAALQKAHRYRVLNDSVAAESICLDVLAVEPHNADAMIMHVLAISDRFGEGKVADLKAAEAALAGLEDAYKRAYYHGIICERWAKGLLHRAPPRAGEMAWDWIGRALDWYERAEKIRPAGNDEAILRWNTCVRMLQRNPQVKPAAAEPYEPSLE